MWIRGKAGPTDFFAEVSQIFFGQPALQKCPRVDTRRTMTLKVYYVALVALTLGPEEVIKSNFKQGGGRCTLWKLDRVSGWCCRLGQRVLCGGFV